MDVLADFIFINGEQTLFLFDCSQAIPIDLFFMSVYALKKAGTFCSSITSQRLSAVITEFHYTLLLGGCRRPSKAI